MDQLEKQVYLLDVAYKLISITAEMTEGPLVNDSERKAINYIGHAALELFRAEKIEREEEHKEVLEAALAEANRYTEEEEMSNETNRNC